MIDLQAEDIRNDISLKSILAVSSIYLIIILYTIGIALIPLIIIWLVAFSISSKEIRSISSDSTNFKRSYPLQRFGASYGEFIHAFYHDIDLEADLFRRIEQDIRSKTPVSIIKPVRIVDTDPALKHSEGRTFLIASSNPTLRGTKISLALRFSKFEKMQTVQWWALAGGYIDSNKRFLFVSFAPFTIWFWIIPYLRMEYDVASQLTTVYSSAYNSFDIQTQAKSIHETVFNALIEELDHQGVDTSVLRAQRVQMMSINIAGGSTNIGNIIQGTMNKVNSLSKGAAT